MSFARPILWTCLGIGLLLGGIGGAMRALRGSNSDTASTTISISSGPAPIAVCFGRVDTPSGVVSLHPLQPGRVTEVRVKEGQNVQNGDVLLSMDQQIAEQLVAQAQQDVEGAKAQLELAAKASKQQELREAEQQAALDVARARLKRAESVLTRKREFVALGQANEKDLPPLIAQVEEAQAAQRAEERKLDELRLLQPEPGQKPLELRRAQADLATKESRLRQAEISLAECQVHAPARGIVLRVLVSKGDVLSAQTTQPAILLAPDEELIVRAEVEQEIAAKVRAGQPVVIEDDANEAYSWTGTVETLSPWFTQRRSILLEPGQLNDVRTLEAIVRLAPVQSADSTRPPLRIGQRVRVVIFGASTKSP